MAKFIELTRGKVAVVDEDDFERVNQFNWFAMAMHGRWYAGRTCRASEKRRQELLHRFILGVPDGITVDHINGDGLDCQKHNLRRATHAENTKNRGASSNNTSGFKGVSWHKDGGGWRAQIGLNGKAIHLGCFTDKLDAARAYNEAALKYHGEFARLNEID